MNWFCDDEIMCAPGGHRGHESAEFMNWIEGVLKGHWAQSQRRLIQHTGVFDSREGSWLSYSEKQFVVFFLCRLLLRYREKSTMD